MSISNVDQQLVDEIKSLMAGVLGNSTLVKSEIMGDLPTDLVDDFVATYCTDGSNRGLEIPVYFSFPTTPPKTAFLLVQYKGSVEDEDSSSLGGVQGSVQDKEEGPVIHEKVAFTYYPDKQALVGTTQSKIYSINSIPQLAIQNIKFDGNTISILDVNDAIGSMFDGLKATDVYYSEYLEDKKSDILPIGINTNEGVTIDFIASNTNTIRCLSALFLYIQIYLRHTIAENYNVYDPKIGVSGMDAIENLQNQGDLSQQLYYRRLTITYKVTQVISQSMAEKIGVIETGNKEIEDMTEAIRAELKKLKDETDATKAQIDANNIITRQEFTNLVNKIDGQLRSIGKDSKGIDSIKVSYATSATSTIPETWSTDLQAPSVENPYQWAKIEVIYTDNTKSVFYSIALSAKGDKGDQGLTGKSAYDIWKDAGNVGDEKVFLKSLIGPKGDAGKSAYQSAVDGGFAGTEKEWINSLKGQDAYQLAVNGGYQGDLKSWLASLKGEKGDQGLPGKNAIAPKLKMGGVKSVASDQPAQADLVDNHDNTYTLTLSIPAGAKGEAGGVNQVIKPQLTIGTITSVGSDEKASASLTKTGETSYAINLSIPSGKAGSDGVGKPGVDGKSAYDLAVENGFKGDLQSWLNSLKGPAGKDAVGAPGKDGKSAYQIWLGQGNTGDEQAFLNSLKGATGAPGKDAISTPGRDGKRGTAIFMSSDTVSTQMSPMTVHLTSLSSADSTLKPEVGDYVIADDNSANGEMLLQINNVTGNTVEFSPNFVTIEGKQGVPGLAGTTPVRGVDYWTDADKAEIKKWVDDAILNGKW